MNKLDQMLYDAYSYREEPGNELNQYILNYSKKDTGMKRFIKKRAVLLAATLSILILGTTAVYGTLKLLNSSEMLADSDAKLAKAFSSKDAIKIDESQSCNGHIITLLGLVSGKKISDTHMHWGEDYKQTYFTLAIENSDGSPQEDVTNLYYHIYLEGYEPQYYDFVGDHYEASKNIDGVEYKWVNLYDEIECFADRTVYLAVSDRKNYSEDLYLYDGKLKRNPDYEGVNALFILKMDSKKADSKRAQKMIDIKKEFVERGKEDRDELTARTPKQKIKVLKNKIDKEYYSSNGEKEAFEKEILILKWLMDLKPKNIDKKAKLIEGYTQTSVPDSLGNFSYIVTTVLGDHGTVSNVKERFDGMKSGMSSDFYYDYDFNSDNGFYVDTYTLNKDGTVTVKVYLYKPNDWNKKVEKYRKN